MSCWSDSDRPLPYFWFGCCSPCPPHWIFSGSWMLSVLGSEVGFYRGFKQIYTIQHKLQLGKDYGWNGWWKAVAFMAGAEHAVPRSAWAFSGLPKAHKALADNHLAKGSPLSLGRWFAWHCSFHLCWELFSCPNQGQLHKWGLLGHTLGVPAFNKFSDQLFPKLPWYPLSKVPCGGGTITQNVKKKCGCILDFWVKAFPSILGKKKA